MAAAVNTVRPFGTPSATKVGENQRETAELRPRVEGARTSPDERRMAAVSECVVGLLLAVTSQCQTRSSEIAIPSLELFAFRYRHEAARHWVRARYVASKDEIAVRHAEWEIAERRRFVMWIEIRSAPSSLPAPTGAVLSWWAMAGWENALVSFGHCLPIRTWHSRSEIASHPTVR